jgi:hypothetical protein
VEVQPLFPIVLAVMGLAHRDLAGAVAWTLVAGASVLWHELGHALAMRWCGSASRIELHAMGGLTHWAAGARPTPVQALAVSAAGPGAGLLLGAAFWIVAERAAPATELAAMVVHDGLWVNVGWSVFNLLPILPLDGAHIVDHGAAVVTGRREPARWVGGLSLALGAVIALVSMQMGSPYTALLGGLGIAAGLARLRGRSAAIAGVAGVPLRAAPPRRRPARAALGRWMRGPGLRARVAEARVGSLPADALARLAVELVERGRAEELVGICRDRLGGFERARDARALARLASEALWEGGERERAVEVSRLAYEQLHAADHAHDAACRLVEMGRIEEGLHWAERAARAAGPDARALLADPALEPLRDLPEFRELVAAAASRAWTN